MFKRIDHVEIVTLDMEKTVGFYTRVLSFSVKQKLPMRSGSPWKEIVFLTLGDTMLELLSPAGPVQGQSGQGQLGYRMMAIEVEDMDKALEYLKGQGVEISRPPLSPGRPSRAEIKDPNGFTIEIRQW
ncbi:MAG: VOC family protein [Chloroflexi bacterium]|nr:VOC family protein [Chloroflexota bacterium]